MAAKWLLEKLAAAARAGELAKIAVTDAAEPVREAPKPVTHTVTHTPAGNARNAEKQAAYRQRKGEAAKVANRDRMRIKRAAKKQ
jgi:hypothetical protein